MSSPDPKIATATHHKHGGARVWLPPPGAFLFTIACAAALEYAGHALPIPLGRTPRVVLAMLGNAAGLALVFSALYLFQRTGQQPEPWKPTPEMILRGPYRFTRNPMYLGLVVLQVSGGLVFDNAWIVLFAPLALALVHYTAVLPEERYLSERFGEAYRQYLARVPRYLWR